MEPTGTDIKVSEETKSCPVADEATATTPTMTTAIKTINDCLVQFCSDGVFGVGEVWTMDCAKEGGDRLQCQTNKRFARCTPEVTERQLLEFQALSGYFRFPAGRDQIGRVYKSREGEIQMRIQEASTTNCPRVELLRDIGVHCALAMPVLLTDNDTTEVAAVVTLFSYTMAPIAYEAVARRACHLIVEACSSLEGKVSIPTVAHASMVPQQSRVTLHNEVLSFEEISKHFGLPIDDAAQSIGICATLIKKMCREQGIERWPFRKLDGLNKSIAALEATLRHSAKNQVGKIHEKAVRLKLKRLYVVVNPLVMAHNPDLQSDKPEEEESSSAVDTMIKEESVAGDTDTAITAAERDTAAICKKVKEDMDKRKRVLGASKLMIVEPLEVSNKKSKSNDGSAIARGVMTPGGAYPGDMMQQQLQQQMAQRQMAGFNPMYGMYPPMMYMPPPAEYMEMMMRQRQAMVTQQQRMQFQQQHSQQQAMFSGVPGAPLMPSAGMLPMGFPMPGMIPPTAPPQ